MTITQAVRFLRAGQISSVALVREALARIERVNPVLNAFLTTLPEQALAEAERSDRLRASGDPCGALCGIPIALKDVFCTNGVRTTCGSTLFADYVPTFDSTVGQKLAAAGAILIGKTGLHELAYGITSNNPHFGSIRNAWNPACIPGGSSGGSGTAVASGMAFAAMGSDTGGSIRIPAAFCGTVGLKPTSGRVSRYGVLPLDYSLDHMGPLTRSVADAATVLNAIAGFDPLDDTSSRQPVDDYLPPPECSLRGVRVGFPETFFLHRLHPEMRTAIDAAFRHAAQLGAEIVSLPLPDIAAINAVGRVILMSEASRAL